MSPMIQDIRHPAYLPPRADKTRQTQRADLQYFLDMAKRLNWTHEALCAALGVSPNAWKEWREGMPYMAAYALDQIYAKFGPKPVALYDATPVQFIGDDVWIIDGGAEAETLVCVLDWVGLPYTIVEKNSFVLRPGDDAPRLRALLDKRNVGYTVLPPPVAKEAA